MKRVLIGGVGNVLLGDDGVGPYVVRMLEALYSFGEGVSIADLGTPALDLTHQIVGLHALILVDSVASDETPGAIVLYRKEDILRVMTADMLGASPEHVLLVGIVGSCYDPGQPLSEAVRQSVAKSIEAILTELKRLGFGFEKKILPNEPEIWWADRPVDEPVLA